MSTPRPRVLAVAHDFPIPADNGSSVRVLAWLHALGGAADVRLVVHPRPTTTPTEVDRLRSVPGVELLLGASPSRPGPKYRVWADALRTATPPWFVMWRDPRVTTVARRELAWATHVLALDDFAGHHLPLLDTAGRPTTLDKHKVYAEPGARGERARRYSPLAAARELALSQLCSVDERRVMAAADRVIVTSPEEAERLERHHGRRPHEVIPSAVENVDPVWDWQAAQASAPTVAWLGTLGSRPNRDGLLRLLAAIRLRRPRFRLLVIGKDVDDGIRDAADGIDVELCGYVEDLGNALSTVRAAVVSLWSGGGGRLKTLELMASGVPVVTTPSGLEGIAAEHRRHCLIGTDEHELVKHLESLLDDAHTATTIGRFGSELVRDQFTWDRVAPRIVDVVLGR